MSQITPGRWRHLQQSSTQNGYFVILAIDHRGNLRTSLNNAAGHPITDAEFGKFKQEVIGALAGECSAVLTDPDFGYASFLSHPNAGKLGLLMPLEVTDYDIHPSQRLTRFIENWSVEQIKKAGGTGVKLLLYYHPEAPNAANQRILVAQVGEQCRLHDIPFFLEPIAYSPNPDRMLSSAEHRHVVIETAKTFTGMGIDILKVEFPVLIEQEPGEATWRVALQELNNVCTVPWTLLSAGAPFPIFKKQAELALAAGASGVIVGRALWAEAVTLQGTARAEFLNVTACERVRELRALCQNGKPFSEHLTLSNAGVGWYR